MCACVVIQCCEVDGDNHSPAPIYMRQWDIVVLDRHLVLLVLAALVVCVGYMCVWWCLTGTWSYVLAICLCVWCLHLVLDALWLYVKSGAWHAPDARREWPLQISNPSHILWRYGTCI